MGWRDDYELRQQQIAGVKQTEKINKALSTIVEGVSKDAPDTLPKIDVPTVSVGSKAVNDNKWSGIEKAMRVYAQNAYDMSDNTPKGVGPQQWSGDNSLNNITFAPGTSIADRAAKAGERATLTYQNAFLPKAEEKISTANSPAMWNGGGDYLVPYTGKNPTVFETTMQNAKNMENPATPTAVRFGTGAYDRVYNALSSIGDSRIGSDMSLKETAKQSVKNEADYRKALDEYDDAIDKLLTERDKYDVTSEKYRKLNNAINAIYDGIDKIRDGSADMTEANKFMQNANLLREQATKDLSGVEKDVANAAISAVDNLISLSVAGISPAAPVVLMGISAAGQNANELSNRGVSAADALGRGVVSGVIEGLTEKIGIDNLYSIIGSGNKNLLVNLLKQSLSEGTEEGLSTVLNYMVDRTAGDNKPFDWEELADAVEQGFLSGAMFGAGGTVVNTVNSYLPGINGYSDKVHYNMAKELEGRKLKGILPDARNYKYSSDVSNSNVNIMGMPAEAYFDKRLPSVNNINTQMINVVPEVAEEKNQNNIATLSENSYYDNRGGIDGTNSGKRQDNPAVSFTNIEYDRRGSEAGIRQELEARNEIDSVGESGRDKQLGNINEPYVSPVTENVRKIMNDKGVADLKLRDSTNDNALFSYSLDEAIKSNPYGPWVDSHTAEQLDEDKTKTFLSEDNMAGVAVEANGNITAVFKNPKNKTSRAVQDLLLTAIANGGNKLDCYGKGLADKYAELGFIPVAKVPFNPDYVSDPMLLLMEPDVYVFMHNGDNVETVVENLGSYKQYTQSELDALPTFTDYDEALAYRDGLILSAKADNGASNKSQIVNNEIVLPIADTTHTINKSNYMPSAYDASAQLIDAMPKVEDGKVSLPKIEVPQTETSDKQLSEVSSKTGRDVASKKKEVKSKYMPDATEGDASLSIELPTKKEKTLQDRLSKSQRKIKNLEYESRFAQAENDLITQIEVGKAKAETKRHYEDVIKGIRERHAKRGEWYRERLRRAAGKNEELSNRLDRERYARRFMEAENDLAAKMAVGKAVAKEKRLKRESIEAKQTRRNFSKVTTDIIKLANKLQKNKKMLPEEKARLNKILNGIDTYGKRLSNEDAYRGMLLKNYVEQIKAENPDYTPSEEVQRAINRLGETRVSTLTEFEAQDLLNALKMVDADVRNRHKLLKTKHYESVKAAADNVIEALNETSNKKDNWFTKTFNVESLNMATLLDRLAGYKNGALKAIKDELTEGQRKKLMYEKESQALFDDILNNKKYQKEIETWAGKKAKWIDTGLKFSDGTAVEICPAQRIEIYMHSQAKDNLAVMLDGGYTLPRKENVIKGKDIDRNSEPIRFTITDINNITAGMSEAEKLFAEKLKQYYNGVSKNGINEVSLELVGYEAATEENYYPRRRNKEYLYKEYSGEEQASIINPGFLKERTADTSIPLQGGNAIETLLKSISDTSDYVGLAIPLRDFKSLLNSTGGYGNTRVRKLISDKYGKSTLDYIEKWLTEINGSRQNKYYLDNLAGKLMKGYAKSILNFNVKTALEQPSAFITAAPSVGYNNIVKALKNNKDIKSTIIKEIDARSPYRWDRGVRGNSRGELSELTNKGDFKAMKNGSLPKAWSKINPMQWINEMDLLTTDMVGVAAYYKVKDDMKISPSNANFWDYVAEEYNKALETTQAMYTPLQRTGLARSDSAITKAVNMFATERNKQYNMVYDAVGKYNAAKKSKDAKTIKEASDNLKNTTSSILLSTVWGSALEVAFGILRRREEYEDEEGNIQLPSIASDFGMAYAGNILGNIFLGSQAYSLAANIFLDEFMYDIEEPTLSMVSDFLNNTASFSKAAIDYFKGSIDAAQDGILPEYMSKEKTKMLKYARKTAYSVSNMIGVPYKNAERFLTTIIGMFSPDTVADYESLFNEVDNSFIKSAGSKKQESYIQKALEERVSKDIDSKTVDGVYNLYVETGKDSGVLPKYEAPSKITKQATKTREAIDYTLTAKDKVKYLDKYSDILERELPEIVNSSYFSNLKTDDRLTAIEYLYKYADEQAKKYVLPKYEVSDAYSMSDIKQSDYKKKLK